MKFLFIPAKEKIKLKEEVFEEIKKLPNKIAICFSIQYIDLAKDIKNRLDKYSNKEITLFAQVLGCSNPKFSKETEAILIVGEGRFHSVSLEYESKIPVYLLENNKLFKVDDKDVEKMRKNERAAITNYLNEEKVGIIVTNKPGQQRFSRAVQFKKKLNSKGNKKPYLFLTNEINISEFENFGLKAWVNTACPRMDLNDYRLVNINLIDKK